MRWIERKGKRGGSPSNVIVHPILTTRTAPQSVGGGGVKNGDGQGYEALAGSLRYVLIGYSGTL
jgi:hypothetical protein